LVETRAVTLAGAAKGCKELQGTAKGCKELQGTVRAAKRFVTSDTCETAMAVSKALNCQVHNEAATERRKALLYCSVDAIKALQGDRTLARDVDSIVD
jgi:tRNA threonylcarbamoyladenosine modification (KEOPS) complex Cgi121 subunit